MPSSTPNVLYRPVGLQELRLIAESGFRAFPPRLPEQPIFYPVLSREYAAQIARDWNTTDEPSGFAGFVTSFEVEAGYLAGFDVRVVGSREHRELWVPSDELAAFNQHILGGTHVVEAFYGSRFTGEVDPGSNLPEGIERPLD